MSCIFSEKRGAMRFLHTADWHIGKVVNGYSMIEDQADYLHRLIDKAKTLDLDAFVMAGDLYDRTMPSKDAVTLANELLTRLVTELKVPILMIAGNHDSSERISYGSNIFSAQGLYMAGITKRKVPKVSVKDTDFYMIPFADHYTIRSVLGKENTIKSIEDATKEQIRQVVASDDFDHTRNNVLIFHGYVIHKSPSSVQESDSERALSIGTVEYVDQAIFKDFDYVALGHLHQAQKVGRESVRYAGSILKYSKSEVTHQKKSLLVELDQKQAKVSDIVLSHKREMRLLKGNFEELMKAPASKDYLYFELTDKLMVQDAMAQLKTKFPNAMALTAPFLTENIQNNTESFDRQEVQEKSIPDLFQLFYHHYLEEELDSETMKVVEQVARESRNEQ